MLKARILTAVFLLAGLLGALFCLPEMGWVAFCALICAGAAWEWGGLAGWGKKARIVYAAALMMLVFVLVWKELTLCMFVLCVLAAVFWLFAVPLWLWRKWPLRSWSAWLVGGIVLVPPTLVFTMVRNQHDPAGLLKILAIMWIADIAAYFAGRTFGGRKLAPSISPGKTWAGAVGAVVGVMVYCNFLALTSLPVDDFTFTGTLFFQLALIVLAALSIVGDLFESLSKRQAGVKDSGSLLPGHGGILDRIDSLTATLPFFGLPMFLPFAPILGS